MKRHFAAVCFLLCLGAGLISAKIDYRTLTIGRAYEMFLHDNTVIAGQTGLKLVHAALQKHPANPVLVADRPWEDGRLGYAAVLYDAPEKLYKMWYQVTDDKETSGRLLYATSKDGIKWEKPILNIVEYKGSKANNLVYADPPKRKTKVYWVMKDYSAPNPAARYKMMHHSWDFRGRGVAVGESPDGLHWTTRDYSSLVGEFDTHNVMFWDDRVGAYVAFLRFMVANMRHIGRSTSPDGYHWSAPVPVHGPDEDDPADLQVYTPGTFKYSQAHNVYVMFPAIFRQKSNTVMAQLGVSRDGIEWYRFRDDFLPRGEEGQWDAGVIYPVASELTVGGKTAVYYKGNHVGHVMDIGKPGIGLGLMHEGGFAGWQATGKGTLTTVPIQVRYIQDLLHLNAEVASGGSITAELLDENGQVIPRFSRAESKPLLESGTMLLLSWGDADPEETFARGAFRLRLHLENATVYGIRCKLRPNYR